VLETHVTGEVRSHEVRHVKNAYESHAMPLEEAVGVYVATLFAKLRQSNQIELNTLTDR